MTQMEKDIHEIAKAITKIAIKDNIKVNIEIIDKNDDTDMPLERTESKTKNARKKHKFYNE